MDHSFFIGEYAPKVSSFYMNLTSFLWICQSSFVMKYEHNIVPKYAN